MKDDIFQWLAEESNADGSAKGDTHIKLQVLRRAVNPQAAMSGGPEFEVTDFTVETLIRGYFVTASSMILDKLVASSNAHRKELYAAALKENETRKTSSFIDRFSPAVASGQATTGGMCFLEPYSAAQDKLLVSGTSFPSQGDRSAKRLRMTVETTDGIAPASFTCDHPVNPDFRLLAGDLSIGNPVVFDIMAAFANVLPAIELEEDLRVPVVLTNHDLETITTDLGLKQQTMLPLWESRVVDFIRGRIAERREYVSSVSETEAVCHSIDKALSKINEAVVAPSTYKRDEYADELKMAVRALRKDPILFVRGPLVQKHYSDTRVSIDDVGFREQLIQGFDVTRLGHFGDYNDDLFRDSKGEAQDWSVVPMYFTTTPYEANPEASMLNTLWNLLVNSELNMCYRLSDWEKAIAPYETMQTLPIPDLEPLPIAPLSSWSSQSAAPERERQFRLSLMGSPHDSGDVTKTEIDLDSPYKQFELEMHLGNRESHLHEAMQVVSTAVRMMFTPYTMPVELMRARDLGGTIDSIVPVFPGDDKPLVHVTKDADRFPAVFYTFVGTERKTSALAAFLYQHAAMQASKPFGSVPPSYQELKALIASANPFPLPDHLRKVCDKITKAVEEGLKKKFKDCIYLTQNPSERSTVQPCSPLFLQFSQATSKNKLNWMLGTEATPVLEAVILALHMVSHLSAEEKTTKAFNDVIFKNDPLVVDVTKPLMACSKPQRSRETTTLFQTPEGVVDCTEYAKYLGLTENYHYLRAGRGFFTGNLKFAIGEGATGCFSASPKTINTGEIAGKRSVETETRFKQSAEDVYVESTDGKFDDLERQPISCYEVDEAKRKSTIVFDIKDSTYCQHMDGILGGGHYVGPCALPMYYDKNKLAGFAYFEYAVIKNKMLTWKESTLTNILCVNSNILKPLYDSANRTYYYFTEDLQAFGISSTFRILKNTPAVYRAKTPPEPAVLPPKQLPFEYTTETHISDASTIATALVDGAQGVHYTNARALSKTVFAGVINTKRDELVAYLENKDPRYAREQPVWAYDLDSGSPMATVLAYLNGVYEQSVTRSTEMPLANRVSIDVRGPSADCLATSCFVGQYYYKTSAYLNAEQLLMERCQKTLRETFKYPPGSTERCLARQFRSGRSITSVDTIVHLRPDAAAFVASILYDFREKQSILHSTQKARNTPALIMNAVAETQKIMRLLFYC